MLTKKVMQPPNMLDIICCTYVVSEIPDMPFISVFPTLDLEITTTVEIRITIKDRGATTEKGPHPDGNFAKFLSALVMYLKSIKDRTFYIRLVMYTKSIKDRTF